jgi:hypothetical protein
MYVSFSERAPADFSGLFLTRDRCYDLKKYFRQKIWRKNWRKNWRKKLPKKLAKKIGEKIGVFCSKQS